MQITYDPQKRLKTLEDRGIDFRWAAEVFEGLVYEIEDTRFDYGEKRVMCFGLLKGRMVVGYVKRGKARHIFSMRKANEKEQKRFKKQLH